MNTMNYDEKTQKRKDYYQRNKQQRVEYQREYSRNNNRILSYLKYRHKIDVDCIIREAAILYPKQEEDYSRNDLSKTQKYQREYNRKNRLILHYAKNHQWVRERYYESIT